MSGNFVRERQRIVYIYFNILTSKETNQEDMLKCILVNFSLAKGDLFNCNGAVRIYQSIANYRL